MTFGFKEILWDTGMVWVVILLMMIGWTFRTIRMWLHDFRERKPKNKKG